MLLLKKMKKKWFVNIAKYHHRTMGLYTCCKKVVKIRLDKLEVSLQKSISKLIFTGKTNSKNPVRNSLRIKFIKLDFSKLIFQKSSADQQGDRVGILTYNMNFQFWAVLDSQGCRERKQKSNCHQIMI